jgi:hypothetical protein
MVFDGVRASAIVVPQELPGGRWGWARTVVPITLDANGGAQVDLSSVAATTCDGRAISERSRWWRIHVCGVARFTGAPSVTLAVTVTEGTAAHGYDWTPGDGIGLPVPQVESEMESVATIQAYGQIVRIRPVRVGVWGGVPADAGSVIIAATIAEAT